MSIMKDIQRYIIQHDGVIGTFWTILTSRGLFAVAIYRFRHWLLHKGISSKKSMGFLVKAISVVCHHLGHHISAVVARAEISPLTEIKSGLFVSNKGNVIIGANSIGEGCVIQENVTIGINVHTHERAAIGDNVWIGANSAISGGITIGNRCTLLDGTVLTKSIPANCVVQGNPARVIKRGFDNSQLMSNPYVPSKIDFKAV